ncbi:hypothetical protein, partial [Paenibacillus sp. GCM10012303]|uniref:hypothetical protein n=1 Tax=Paenibacillus sp. GCM10012303 TaxID=3317340 RepID=UPI0036D369F7
MTEIENKDLTHTHEPEKGRSRNHETSARPIAAAASKYEATPEDSARPRPAFEAFSAESAPTTANDEPTFHPAMQLLPDPIRIIPVAPSRLFLLRIIPELAGCCNGDFPAARRTGVSAMNRLRLIERLILDRQTRKETINFIY